MRMQTDRVLRVLEVKGVTLYHMSHRLCAGIAHAITNEVLRMTCSSALSMLLLVLTDMLL
jgi:hypothetical protein